MGMANGMTTATLSSSAPAPHQQPGAGASCPPVSPRVLLVCGADVLHSMADPTMWRQDLLEVTSVAGACPVS